jgi:hypothetical protein
MQNTVPETQKRTRAKKGGSMSDVANHTSGLIVPWAIMLAKQAMQGVLDKPSKEKVGVATSAKKSPAPSSAKKSSSKKKQSGGECSSCASVASTSKKVGGNNSRSSPKKTSQKNEYNDLANKIQDFLSRY